MWNPKLRQSGFFRFTLTSNQRRSATYFGHGRGEFPPSSAQTTCENPGQAFLETQLAEHRKIKKIFRFFCRDDDLDTSVSLAIENILSETPTKEVAEFQMSEVLDIIHGLPTVETVLEADFFHRITLPFRHLRRCLDLHIVNHINEERINSVPFLKMKAMTPDWRSRFGSYCFLELLHQGSPKF